MDLQAADVESTPLVMELSSDKILDSPPVSGMTVPKAQRPRTVSGTGGRASMFGGSNSKPKAEKPKKPEPEVPDGEPPPPRAASWARSSGAPPSRPKSRRRRRRLPTRP